MPVYYYKYYCLFPEISDLLAKKKKLLRSLREGKWKRRRRKRGRGFVGRKRRGGVCGEMHSANWKFCGDIQAANITTSTDLLPPVIFQ